MNRTQRDLILLAAGIGIGVGLGMLLAPRSGQETRQALNRSANQAVERGRDYWQRIRSRIAAGDTDADLDSEG
jgi:gas vesicle protein